jgi:hypothetical protein
LFAVLGSGVELATWAVFVTHPLPLLGAEVVIVNVAFPLWASEASAQRTVCVALKYVHSGDGDAETNDTLDGSVSVTTTFCAGLGPWLLTPRVQVATPFSAPVFASARSALCGGVTT